MPGGSKWMLSEVHYLVDRAFEARLAGHPLLANAFARAAEKILRLSYPTVAREIALAAGRKGQGRVLGERLSQYLDARPAACVAVVLMLLEARRTAVSALTEAYSSETAFWSTFRTLCARVVGAPHLST
ncbi:MAG: hypothetical protein ABL889_00200 [Terricaulis sp.]